MMKISNYEEMLQCSLSECLRRISEIIGSVQNLFLIVLVLFIHRNTYFFTKYTNIYDIRNRIIIEVYLSLFSISSSTIYAEEVCNIHP